MTRSRRPWPWWRRVLTGLSGLALTLSCYLGWHYLAGGSVIGCGGGSSCDEVLNSRWSAVFGALPVGGLAAGAYLAMLVASFFSGRATEAPVRRLAWRAMIVLAGAILGSAVWFTIVQLWIVRALCPYCMATHLTGLLLAALVIWQAPKQFEEDAANPATASRRVVPPFLTPGLTFGGLTLAAILAVCQVAFTPPAAYRGGTAQDALPAQDAHSAPMAGSPDARFVVTLLFDYECPHCQQLHFMLDEAIRRYDGKLAFVLCPTPLNTQCNPYVPRDVDEFKDSCELAKIGLAVWTAKREAFPVFNRWMFSLESGDKWQPRSIAAARAKAIELVGQAKFEAAEADPWVGKYLQTCVGIYGKTVQGRRGNAVPKLVFGPRWVIPQVSDAGELVSLLHEGLGVPAPDEARK